MLNNEFENIESLIIADAWYMLERQYYEAEELSLKIVDAFKAAAGFRDKSRLNEIVQRTEKRRIRRFKKWQKGIKLSNLI
jgi:hypothetical protein